MSPRRSAPCTALIVRASRTWGGASDPLYLCTRDDGRAQQHHNAPHPPPAGTLSTVHGSDGDDAAASDKPVVLSTRLRRTRGATLTTPRNKFSCVQHCPSSNKSAKDTMKFHAATGSGSHHQRHMRIGTKLSTRGTEAGSLHREWQRTVRRMRSACGN